MVPKCTIPYLEVLYVPCLFFGCTKLIKIYPSTEFHRWLKTLAANEGKRLPDYILAVLERSVPSELSYKETRQTDIPTEKKSLGKKSKN